jgi:sigma-54 dependent transcriptional regulator, acetoin dehydrogenase operon transcriptional activator AcoR
VRRIIFVSKGDTGLASIAKSVGLSLSEKEVEFEEAFVDFSNPPAALSDLLAEAGLPPAGADAHQFSVLDLLNHDLIVTFDASIKARWGALIGSPIIVYWDAGVSSEQLNSAPNALKYARSALKTIRNLLSELLSRCNISQLIACHQKLVRFFERIDLAVIVHDKNRCLTYFNRVAEEITGYSREEVIGKDCHALFQWRLCGSNCSFCNRSFRQPSSFWFTRDIQRKDGKLRHVEMTIIPVDDAQGKTHGVMVSFRDLTHRMRVENRFDRLKQFMEIVGRSPSMLHVFEAIQDAGPTDVSVLIQGESGTGKELVAEALHKISKRASKSFIVVNCGALPEGLLESELFGHVKGAFTGAVRDKKGRFELADGGTIFLDEIGDLTPLTQVKILRVLENGTFERVGSEQTMRVNVRVIAATNRNLEKLMVAHHFRGDLYYRLCGFPIHLPALRERKEDIPLLAELFLQKTAMDLGHRANYAPELIELLGQYSWPGNVRQLQNVLQYAVIKSKGNRLSAHHLPADILREAMKGNRRSKPGRPKKLTADLAREALEKSGGNKVKAAAFLGVSRATLYRLLKIL